MNATNDPNASADQSQSGQGGQSNQGGGQATSAQNASVQPVQPEYGQFKQPEYGQMASQYPGWDPYVFGRPEPKDDGKGAEGNAARGGAMNGNGAPGNGAAPGGPSRSGGRAGNPWAGQPSPYPGAPQGNVNGTNGWNNGQGHGANGQNANGQNNGAGRNSNDPRFMMQPIDLDDPNQNPFYGRWDVMATIAMVCAVLFPPVGLILALFSMRRTRLFHMRGRGLAIAALVIAIIGTIVEILVSIYGFDGYLRLIGNLTGVDMSQFMDMTGGSGSGTGGVSA